MRVSWPPTWLRRAVRIGALCAALLLAPAIISAQAPAPVLDVHDVQGASHLSPYARQTVTVRGIVTVVAPRGFYMESVVPDDSEATSEGVYVDTFRRPALAPGDLVVLTGRVAEEYPGGMTSGNLPVTTIVRPDIEVRERDAALPPPQIIGTDGRVPPDRIVTDDANGLVEESPFDPEEDGIDFYESLEGMRVQVNDALSVGTVHRRYGEIWVVPDGGAGASVLTPRGGIALRDGDVNPERVLIDYLEDELIHRQTHTPDAVVGDRFNAPIVGVMSYSWYNYKILPIGDLPPVSRSNLPREVSQQADSAPGRQAAGGVDAQPGLVSIAAFNVENLSGRSPAAKFADIADTIVTGLGAPDIVMLSEIQDGDGPTRSDTVSSEATAQRLLAALTTAGAPGRYEYRDLPPAYNADGGQPNANIRVGFLYRTDRVELVPGSLERLAVDHPAFVNSRKSLAGRFRVNDREITVIANHFSSKGGDGALFGRVQPPVARSEPGRIEQARAVNAWVASLLESDSRALVVVGGDLNDFEFSRTLRTLAGGELVNLADALPPNEVYSYIYEGNSQALDHILVSRALLERLAGPVDYVHRYAEYLYEERSSDHDPVIARFELP